jgi:hypothetical protein
MDTDCGCENESGTGAGTNYEYWRANIWSHPTVIALKEESKLEQVMRNYRGYERKTKVFQNLVKNSSTGRMQEFSRIILQDSRDAVNISLTLEWVADWLLLNWPGPPQEKC